MTPESTLEISTKSSDAMETALAPVVKPRPSNGNTALIQPAGRGPGRPWAKGQSGNPKGKPRGAWSRSTVGATLAGVLARKGKAVLRKAIEAALAGDTTAMKLVLDRCLPRERLVVLGLPKIRCAQDAMQALATIMDHASEGSITSAEAANLSALARSYVEIAELREIKEKLANIETRLGSP
jgi:hypothetical protein